MAREDRLVSTAIFFLKHAGELHIIVLIEEVFTAIIVHLLALSSIGNIGIYDAVIIYSAKDLKVLFMSRASMKKAGVFDGNI